MDNILSIAAIILSILSLLLSVYVTWKDRGRLKIYAHPVKHPDTDEYSFISINVVNTGRRVVLMKYFVGEYFDGSTARYCLNSTCEAVVLTEGQDFKYKLGSLTVRWLICAMRINMKILKSKTACLKILWVKSGK
ncbi:hypothetical protein Y011_24575 [Vibrio parahaemolyticus VP49]|nr:hypothetical protein Y011_24575 [Vibrio parahaemolyticus VP49]